MVAVEAGVEEVGSLYIVGIFGVVWTLVFTLYKFRGCSRVPG